MSALGPYKFRIKELGTSELLVQRREFDEMPEPGSTIDVDGRVYTVASVFVNGVRFGTIRVVTEPVIEPFGLCPYCHGPNLAPGLVHQCPVDQS